MSTLSVASAAKSQELEGPCHQEPTVRAPLKSSEIYDAWKSSLRSACEKQYLPLATENKLERAHVPLASTASGAIHGGNCQITFSLLTHS